MMGRLHQRRVRIGCLLVLVLLTGAGIQWIQNVVSQRAKAQRVAQLLAEAVAISDGALRFNHVTHCFSDPGDLELAIKTLESCGESPLHDSVVACDARTAVWLIENGADRHFISAARQRVCHIAAFACGEEMLTALAKHGCDCFGDHDGLGGVMPVELAIMNNNVAALNWFVGTSIVSINDTYRVDPLLHTAILHANRETMAFLLNQGANIDVHNGRGQSTIEVAQSIEDSSRREWVIAMLQSRAGK